MSLFVFTSNSIGPGVQTVTSDAHIFLPAGITLARTDGAATDPAIIFTGHDNQFDIYGTLLAEGIGVQLGDSTSDFENEIFIAAEFAWVFSKFKPEV